MVDLIKKFEQGQEPEPFKGEDELGFSPEESLEKEESLDLGFEDRENLAETISEGEKDKVKTGEGFSAGAKPVVPARIQKSEREIKIEKVLSDGLDDIFLSLPPKKQEEFKNEGEKAASKINVLLDKAKVSVEKIITIIKKWLSIIPKVNKYFLEQESKIKADQIIKMKK